MRGSKVQGRGGAVVVRRIGTVRREGNGDPILYITLPASLPSIVAALPLGGALVIVGVIVAEMLGAAEGLGFLITRPPAGAESGLVPGDVR